MSKKAERMLKGLKRYITGAVSELDGSDAIEVLCELAEWCGDESEALEIDDEPVEDDYTDEPRE
jgi:hypothetical protein